MFSHIMIEFWWGFHHCVVKFSNLILETCQTPTITMVVWACHMIIPSSGTSAIFTGTARNEVQVQVTSLCCRETVCAKHVPILGEGNLHWHRPHILKVIGTGSILIRTKTKFSGLQKIFGLFLMTFPPSTLHPWLPVCSITYLTGKCFPSVRQDWMLGSCTCTWTEWGTSLMAG